jgi:CRP/FNR family cyclic AMP-dependent transcriptional regulator
LIAIRQYGPQEVVFREHERGETAFVIEKGKVEVVREKDGKAVHIAYLEAGSVFGEMGVVDDAPRNATVIAVEETWLREIRRDSIYGTVKDSPDAVIGFLKGVLERLREANMRIARLEAALKALAPRRPSAPREDRSPDRPAPHPAQTPNAPLPPSAAATAATSPAPARPASYSIEGLTPEAIEALPDNPFTFTSFPLKIGRKTHDSQVNNHLEIADHEPLQISRHHVSIVCEQGRLGVIDRGSRLGAMVDDVRIGGKTHAPGPAFFKGDEGILILGKATSPYKYRVRRLSAVSSF